MQWLANKGDFPEGGNLWERSVWRSWEFMVFPGIYGCFGSVLHGANHFPVDNSVEMWIVHIFSTDLSRRGVDEFL
ncbi:hypothetical protein Q4560_15630 [Celeribacter halophilus]|uniref:Uncharacterized protein n=1 Tax=Celeribacter halophilus TaxID=576117 RepID=A0AAW7XXW8_9RHOB|nr:hypothetical protein [Celeribacter halophilus]MDO6458952.1 hypothetical protein [Celeribacter halophilus]MDO6724702.1 hypothetical protein [Celeribacter halophilus]